MWQILDKGREPLRKKLADLAGTSHEEIAINRNATEALATVTWGLTLSKGDEIVMTRQDYPNMIQAWKQKELREGIRIKWLNFELPVENDDTILRSFIDATTTKKENIAGLWPLFPNEKPQTADIRKFETLGTRSFATEQAIGQAIDFHNAIGSKRKEERLRFLKNYWCERVKQNSRIKLNISLKPEYACALGNFSIDGMDAVQITWKLMQEYQIHTVGIKWESLNGVRVTPHVYTTTKDLDRFIEAVLKIAAS